MIARTTYMISQQGGDLSKRDPGSVRKNVTICPTLACTNSYHTIGELPYRDGWAVPLLRAQPSTYRAEWPWTRLRSSAASAKLWGT